LKSILLLAFAAAATWAAAGFSNEYNITAVKGINHGAVKLARTNTVTPSAATINWGDGTTSRGFIAHPCVYCDLYGTNHAYAAAGAYTITVTYNTGCCVSYTTKVRANVREIGANDFIVVSVGDSVASGEGNPIIPGAPALWSDGLGGGSACHLSTTSGPAIAVNKLRAANPNTPITFLHLACSGAGVYSALGNHDTSQLKTALNIIGTRNIDALLISAGANDIAGGFGNIVGTCANQYNCSNDTELSASISNGVSNLPTKFDDHVANSDRASEVYLSEYYDPTKDAGGNYNGACTFDVLRAVELQFLDEAMLMPMNSSLASIAASRKWNFVGDIASNFRYHGICANALDTWIVNLLGSGVTQLNIAGTGHPNAAGHQAIADRLAQAVTNNTAATTTTATARTYPDGKPVNASYLTGGWINTGLQLTLTGTNKLPSAGVRPFFRIVSTSTCTDKDWSGATYSQPVVFSNSTDVTVCYFSGNNAYKFRESVKTARIRIDRTFPVTAATVSGRVVTLSATDTFSGVNKTYFRVNGGSWTTGTSLDLSRLKPGLQTIEFFSDDKAGNRETAKSITVTI
jgi:hypothetical protein